MDEKEAVFTHLRYIFHSVTLTTREQTRYDRYSLQIFFSLRQGRQLMGLEPASSIYTPSPDYRNVILIFHDYVGDWTILRGVCQYTSLPVAAGSLG